VTRDWDAAIYDRMADRMTHRGWSPSIGYVRLDIVTTRGE
jgi:hypothetical protein